MIDQTQRKALMITAKIVAGEGGGPLSPTPVDFRRITFAMDPVALNTGHAILMRLTPEAIPLIREAPRQYYRYPLTDFSPEDIVVYMDSLSVKCGELLARYAHSFRLSSGWVQGSCQSTKITATVGESA